MPTTEDISEHATVALLGGTGDLGQLIGHALLDTGVQVRALVRPGSTARAAGLQQRGAVLVEGDLSAGQEAALAMLCDGATAVVSAIQGGPDAIIDGQLRVLAAAVDAGVGRFVPSDYSLDFFGLSEGKNISSDWRRNFADAAREQRRSVQVTHVLNGCFNDRRVLYGFLGAIDLQASNANLWGDGEHPMQFTTYADTAAYVAAAVVGSDDPPRRLKIAGDSLDFQSLVRACERGIGRELTVRRHGSLADLDALIDERQASRPDDLGAYLPVMYWRAMLDGTGALDSLDNDLYPSIRPMTVAEYAASADL